MFVESFAVSCTLLTTDPHLPLTLPDSDVRSASPAETGETGSFHTPDILDTSSELRDEPDFSVVVCATLCSGSLIPRVQGCSLGMRPVWCSAIALVHTGTICQCVHLRFLNLKIKLLSS